MRIIFKGLKADSFNRKMSHHSDRIGPCPSCHKKNVKLNYTINQRGISVSTCAHRSIPQQLRSEEVGECFQSKCFAVCQNCSKFSLEAIKAADIQLNGQLACLSKQLYAERVGEGFKNRCFAACRPCFSRSLEAIQAANAHFNGEVTCLFEQPKTTKAKILQSPLYCGEGKTLV